MNAPAPFESFLVFDGEKKIAIEKDTKVPNAAIFKVSKEDHTIGNLKHQLLKDPQVLFAGYKCPHPLEHKFIFRVQTTSDTAELLLVPSLILWLNYYYLKNDSDHLTSFHSPLSSSPSLFCSTIFRVRRKRTVYPHEALVISLKRPKQMSAGTEPIICFRTSATNLKLEFGGSQCFNIIDVDPYQNIVNIVNTVRPPPSNTDDETQDRVTFHLATIWN
uniref:RNA_pol_L_2 domain-containing protein n=1 Tax=Wuchereria bancrofti TaxID=6293 RepID=A0A1I8EWG5_WUCBA